MDHDTRADDAEPETVRLHLHRGIGWGVYGTATVAVFVLVLLGAVAYLGSGRFVMAAVVLVVGLAVTGFLAVITHAMVVPGLTVTAAGVRGRIPGGHRVDAPWTDVTVDVDEDAEPGALRLGVGEESIALRDRSWVGFGDFVLLVASTPAATDRLTPAAVLEVTRLLRSGVGPGHRSDRSQWH